jgi:hypothetical protein
MKENNITPKQERNLKIQIMIKQSMSCRANTCAESFFASLKKKEI